MCITSYTTEHEEMYRIISMRVHRRQYNYANSMTGRNRQGKKSYSKQPTCRYNALHTRTMTMDGNNHPPAMYLFLVDNKDFHVYGTWQRTSQIRNVVGDLNTAYPISHSRPQEKKKNLYNGTPSWTQLWISLWNPFNLRSLWLTFLPIVLAFLSVIISPSSPKSGVALTLQPPLRVLCQPTLWLGGCVMMW